MSVRACECVRVYMRKRDRQIDVKKSECLMDMGHKFVTFLTADLGNIWSTSVKVPSHFTLRKRGRLL